MLGGKNSILVIEGVYKQNVALGGGEVTVGKTHKSVSFGPAGHGCGSDDIGFSRVQTLLPLLRLVRYL